jgi:hypothetical protein
MNDSIGFVLRGRFVHAVGSPGELEFIEDGCVAVGEDGAILHVAKTTEDVELLLSRTDQVPTCVPTSTRGLQRRSGDV